MAPPPEGQPYFLKDREAKNLNHPANIKAIYSFASALYSVSLEEFARNIERNFLTFLGPVLSLQGVSSTDNR
jgi:Tat protein secretion system quality control protein TatD with DNase activity